MPKLEIGWVILSSNLYKNRQEVFEDLDDAKTEYLYRCFKYPNEMHEIMTNVSNRDWATVKRNY